MEVIYNNINPEENTMYKVTLLYGHPADPDSFEKYYEETHIPIAARMEGVSRMEFTRFLTGPSGEKPPYYRMAEIYFDGQAELKTAFASTAGQAATNDLPNFATGGVEMIIGTVQEMTDEFDADRIF